MKAECGWEFNEIIISLKGTKVVLGHEPYDKDKLKYGVISEGTTCFFTLEQAKELAKSLKKAIYFYEDLEQSIHSW